MTRVAIMIVAIGLDGVGRLLLIFAFPLYYAALCLFMFSEWLEAPGEAD